MALAALFQAAQLVQLVARRGQAPDSDIEASVGSLFHIDAPSTETIFGDATALATGVHAMLARLAAGGTREE
ncbi:MAG: DUF489 family protein, partial [Thiohalobacteraceae bacterium]